MKLRRIISMMHRSLTRVGKGSFLFLSSLVLITALMTGDGIRIKLLDQFDLPQEDALLERIYHMAVDEKEMIYIPDSKAGDIKIYNSDGTLNNVFGRKGRGPGEFISPIRIDIDCHRICVQDIGHYKYLLFDRSFNEITRIFYLMSWHWMILDGDRLITNEYYRDDRGREFKGVILDFSGKVLKTLLPITAPKDDAFRRISGSVAYIDTSKEGEIFFVKASAVRVYKFCADGELLKTFGKEPMDYRPPRKSKDFEGMLEKAGTSEGREASFRYYTSASWVSGLFVFEDFLGLAIRSFNRESKQWDCYLQFYNLDGNLIEEGIALKECGSSSWEGFFSDSNHLDRIYILEEVDGYSPSFRFTKYEILR